jgi:D-3-phosphoglycerate dehydrogenase
VFEKEVLIVDYYGFKLNFEPSPYVIALQNIDKPGIIGQIGTVLGNNGINVAAIQLGRSKKGEKAVSFLSVDGIVSEDILNLLRDIDGVTKASKIAF